ncbi:ribosome silencing factor [bacterium B17]|nr:ribosome silencing factor [bacterium B17]
MSDKKEASGGLDTALKAAAIMVDKKAKDPVLLDVREISGVTDYYLIVSGSSAPHLKAMFMEVQRVLKQEGLYCFRRSGESDAGWMVIDYFDFVIHIFLEETREYYGIEELWAQAPKVKIPLQ